MSQKTIKATENILWRINNKMSRHINDGRHHSNNSNNNKSSNIAQQQQQHMNARSDGNVGDISI